MEFGLNLVAFALQVHAHTYTHTYPRRTKGDIKGFIGVTPFPNVMHCTSKGQDSKCDKFLFFSGVPLVECCPVDDTSPENTITGLPPVYRC